MLVLSRKKNESVMIADGTVRITVVEIRGDKVRLGFDAPKEIDVHRTEVFEAIKRQGPTKAQKPEPTAVVEPAA